MPGRVHEERRNLTWLFEEGIQSIREDTQQGTSVKSVLYLPPDQVEQPARCTSDKVSSQDDEGKTQKERLLSGKLFFLKFIFTGLIAKLLHVLLLPA